jgi:hypothetical protein
LFDENPVGIAGNLKGMTQEEVELLQETAWSTVQEGFNAKTQRRKDAKVHAKKEN